MVYVLLGTGFEEIEAISPVDLMRRAGIEVKYAGIGGDVVTGANGIAVRADVRVEDIDLDRMEMIVLPGGNRGVASIGESPAAVRAIRAAHERGKFIAAICAAPTLLGRLGLLKGVRAVCYPGMEPGMVGATFAGSLKTCQDGKIITGQAPGAAIDFGLKLIEALRGEQAARKVREAIFY